MSAFHYLEAVFRESLFVGLLWNWLIGACIEVFFLVGIILAVQKFLRRRLSLHWSYYLWVFVVLRLIFSLSLSLYFKWPGPGLQFSSVSITLFWIWAAGAGFIFLSSWTRAALFLGRLSRLPRVDDADINALFAACCEEVGMNLPVRLLVSREFASPASAGCIRSSVILPASLLDERISREELRFIFLHELAHLKRFDLFMQWVTLFMRTVFWFHPVVWYALWKMESDCELNCDALALSFLDEKQKYDYGQLLLKTMERVSSLRRSVPVLAGFCTTGAQIRRRINLIAGFNRAQMHFVPHMDFAVILVLGLLVFNLPGHRMVSASKIRCPFVPILSANHMGTDDFLFYRALDEYVPNGTFCGQSFVANNSDILGLCLDIGKEHRDNNISLITGPVDLVLFKARETAKKDGYVIEREIARRRFFPDRAENSESGRRDFLFLRPVPLELGGTYIAGLQSHGMFSLKLRNPFLSTYPHGSAVRKEFLSRVALKQAGDRDYLFRIYSTCEPDYEYMNLYSPRHDSFLTPELPLED